jgi:hypothetical protein
MDVNEWMSYECSDEGPYTQNIHNSSTRSHPSEEENRSGNRSGNRNKIASVIGPSADHSLNIITIFTLRLIIDWDIL